MSEEANQVITAICEEQCMLNYKVNMLFYFISIIITINTKIWLK